jgi:hypothetical protein
MHKDGLLLFTLLYNPFLHLRIYLFCNLPILLTYFTIYGDLLIIALFANLMVTSLQHQRKSFIVKMLETSKAYVVIFEILDKDLMLLLLNVFVVNLLNKCLLHIFLPLFFFILQSSLYHHNLYLVVINLVYLLADFSYSITISVNLRKKFIVIAYVLLKLG